MNIGSNAIACSGLAALPNTDWAEAHASSMVSFSSTAASLKWVGMPLREIALSNTSSVMSAPSGIGDVGVAIVSRKRAGAHFHTHHAHGHAAGPFLPLMVCRAQASARCFAWLRGGCFLFSFLFHLAPLSLMAAVSCGRGAFVSNNTSGAL